MRALTVDPGSSVALAPRGWLDVWVTLRHYAIVTFAVMPDALARHLPLGFEPEVFTLKSGDARAFVSAVTFLDVRFRLRVAPWPRFSFGQTNYRAYVLHRGKRAAWFFGTSLATPFVLVPRYLWRMPWHHARMRFDVEWAGDRCERYRLKTRARWGAAELIASGSDEPVGTLDGFTTAEETAVVLTHPTDAYYRRRDGGLATYSIAHAPLQARRGIVERARFTAWESLGLVAQGDVPHSVLLQRESDYAIYLPPRLIESP